MQVNVNIPRKRSMDHAVQTNIKNPSVILPCMHDGFSFAQSGHSLVVVDKGSYADPEVLPSPAARRPNEV